MTLSCNHNVECLKGFTKNEFSSSAHTFWNNVHAINIHLLRVCSSQWLQKEGSWKSAGMGYNEVAILAVLDGAAYIVPNYVLVLLIFVIYTILIICQIFSHVVIESH